MTKLKTPIIYGLVVAFTGSLLMLSLIGLNLIGPKAIELETEMTGETILFLMLYLFLLFGIYFAIKKRKESQNHQLSFQGALTQGFVVSLSAAIFSVIFTIMFYEWLFPDYVMETMEALKVKMQDNGVSDEGINAKLSEKRAYYSTTSQCFYSFVGNLITGVAFTLLLSFFLKSNSKK